MKLPARWQARWDDVSAREQRLVLAALALLLVAALWWVGLAPALRTLRDAPSQHRLLEAQLQQMQRLQAQATTLQTQPPLAMDEARRRLDASVRPLGATAQLSIAGERVTVSLKGASADALAQWLAQVRLAARTVPSEARLTRNAAGTWDGSVVLTLSTR